MSTPISGDLLPNLSDGTMDRREALGALFGLGLVGAAALLGACSSDAKPNTVLPIDGATPSKQGPTVDQSQGAGDSSQAGQLGIYLPYWGNPVRRLPLGESTRVYLAFGLPNAKERIIPPPTNIQAAALSEIPVEQLSVSIGGWGNEAATDQTSRAAVMAGWGWALKHPSNFADATVAVREKVAQATRRGKEHSDSGKFVGVDIDFEHPTAEQREAGTELISEISARLEVAPLDITLDPNPETLANGGEQFGWDLPNIIGEVDTLNAMLYGDRTLTVKAAVARAVLGLQRLVEIVGPEKIAAGLTNDPADPMSDRRAQETILATAYDLGIKRHFVWDAGRPLPSALTS